MKSMNVNVVKMVILSVALFCVSLLTGCAGSIGNKEAGIVKRTAQGEWKIIYLEGTKAHAGIGEEGTQAANNMHSGFAAGDHSTGNGAGTNPDNYRRTYSTCSCSRALSADFLVVGYSTLKINKLLRVPSELFGRSKRKINNLVRRDKK